MINEINILLADRCTKEEAERYLQNGSFVLEEKEAFKWLKKEWDSDFSFEDIKKGKVSDFSFVEYEGNGYVIVYVV